MNNLPAVLKRRRAVLGLTLLQIANKMGVTEATVQRWESGYVKTVNYDKMVRLAEILGVSPLEFLGLNSPDVTTDVVSFDIVGDVAAHYGRIGEMDAMPERIEIPSKFLRGRPARDYFVLRVVGDSMYPLYQNGDIVLVLRTPTLQHSGQIGVVQHGDETTIKRVEFKMGEDWMRLVPVNPLYQPEMIEGSELETCSVQGMPRLVIREVTE